MRDTCMDNFGRASVPSVTVIRCILVCGKEMQPLWPRSWVSLFDFYFSIKPGTYLTHLIRKLSSRFGKTLECESAFSAVHFGNQNVGLIIMYVLILFLMTMLCLNLRYAAWKIYIGTWWTNGKILNHFSIMCLSDLDYLAKWNILLKFIIFFLLFK